VAVIVAATFWTWLWGPIGLLLSTPLTVGLVVLGRHVEHLAFLEVILGDEPALAPEENFYQRMLANDPHEAADQAEQFLKERSLSAFYDEVAIPGLALAQVDLSHGLLDADKLAQIRIGVRCEPGEALATANIFRLETTGVLMVCLSYLDASRAAEVRYLVRRVRRKLPNARILVGFWRLRNDLVDANDTIGKDLQSSAGADLYATSLRQAVDLCIEAARIKGEAPTSSADAELLTNQIGALLIVVSPTGEIADNFVIPGTRKLSVNFSNVCRWK
jgi:hypothetical protein